MSPYAAQSASDRATKKAIARLHNAPHSTKKINVVAKLIRRLHLDDAVIQLSLLNKRKAACILLKLVLTARAAAHQASLRLHFLVVDEVIVLRARYAPRPVIWRGKGGVGRPRSSKAHIYVRLREVEGAQMKTIVMKPWWERRHAHRQPRQRQPRLQAAPAPGSLAGGGPLTPQL